MLPLQTRPGSNGNKGLLCIPQSSSITGTSPSDCLVSYQDTRLWGVVLLYSPSNLAKCICNRFKNKSLKLSYPCVVVANVLIYDISMSKFEFLLQYYVQLQANNIHRKCMNSLILPAIGYIVQLLLFYKDCFGRLVRLKTKKEWIRNNNCS